MLPTVDEILAALPATSRETFSATRYPYTYAADMIRNYPEIVPAQYRPDTSTLFSRAEASRALQAWATGEGMPGDEHNPHSELAKVVADAYLRLNSIQKP